MNSYIGKYLRIFGLLTIIGCGGTFQPPDTAEKPAEKKAPETSDKFNPLDQPEDFVIIPAAVLNQAVSDTVGGAGGEENE